MIYFNRTKPLSALTVFLLLLFLGCSKEIVDDQPQTNSNLDSDDTAVSLEGDLQISDFVWKG